MAAAIPLAEVADAWLATLARSTGSAALAAIAGATLLGERAMLAGWRIPGRTSAGGGCRLHAARGGDVAINLSRPDDRELLPALFGREDVTGEDEASIAAAFARSDPDAIVARGRAMGLAIAGVDEVGERSRGCLPLTDAPLAPPPAGRAPRVLDLSALWAGPLAAHLLWLAGGSVTKIESRTRPDAMRDGDAGFFALLNQGKASVVLDLRDGADRAALLALIDRSDIVIEAARPRALRQLGIDADAIVRARAGLAWITITGHGAQGEAADWVGFGDDAGVAAGLSAALRAATGRAGFVGDAIADPLAGIRAATAGWTAWASGGGGRHGVALSGVAAEALGEARARDGAALDRSLAAWAQAAGDPFPAVARRAAGPVSRWGSDTRASLAADASC